MFDDLVAARTRRAARRGHERAVDLVDRDERARRAAAAGPPGLERSRCATRCWPSSSRQTYRRLREQVRRCIARRAQEHGHLPPDGRPGGGRLCALRADARATRCSACSPASRSRRPSRPACARPAAGLAADGSTGRAGSDRADWSHGRRGAAVGGGTGGLGDPGAHHGGRGRLAVGDAGRRLRPAGRPGHRGARRSRPGGARREALAPSRVACSTSGPGAGAASLPSHANLTDLTAVDTDRVHVGRPRGAGGRAGPPGAHRRRPAGPTSPAETPVGRCGRVPPRLLQRRPAWTRSPRALTDHARRRVVVELTAGASAARTQSTVETPARPRPADRPHRRRRRRRAPGGRHRPAPGTLAARGRDRRTRRSTTSWPRPAAGSACRPSAPTSWPTALVDLGVDPAEPARPQPGRRGRHAVVGPGRLSLQRRETSRWSSCTSASWRGVPGSR